MVRIPLTKFNHRTQEQRKISFPFKKIVNAKVKAFPGIKYSAWHRCFYLPFSKDNGNAISVY